MSISRAYRVLIADQDPATAFCLRAQLTNLGHRVIAQATDGAQVVALARQLDPELIVMDTSLPCKNGLDTSMGGESLGPCPFVLLGAGGDTDLLHATHSLAFQAYLVRPVSEKSLGPAIELAVDHFNQVKQLQRELTQLRKVLSTRATLRGAIEHLAARHRCSVPREDSV